MTQRATSSDLWRRARTIPLLVALATAFNEAGVNSAAAATLLTLAVPVTAGVFIYEVSVLRDAQLQREAVDRSRQDATSAFPKVKAAAEHGGRAPVAASTDLSGHLDIMLSHRTALLDTFGDEAASVAPVYAGIIKRMLKDDETTFAVLKSERERSGSEDAASLVEKEVTLRAVHDRLAKLVGL